MVKIANTSLFHRDKVYPLKPLMDKVLSQNPF